jgi:hypothetical protein
MQEPPLPPRYEEGRRWLVPGLVGALGGLIVGVVLGAAVATSIDVDGDSPAAAPTPEPSSPAFGRITVDRLDMKAEELRDALADAGGLLETLAEEDFDRYLSCTEACLYARGWRPAPGVVLSSLELSEESFCVVAQHGDIPPGHEWSMGTYNSFLGAPEPADSC